MATDTRQKNSRWYDHGLGICYGIIAATITAWEDLVARDYVHVFIVFIFCILCTWGLNVFILWALRFLGSKIDKRRKPQAVAPIPPTWQEITAPMDRIHIYAFLATLVIAGISIGIFYLLWGKEAIQLPFGQLMLFLLIGIILHELCHALGWMTAGKVSFSSIKFGILWRHIAPYAHCKIALPVSVHRFALVLPSIITTLLTGLGLVLGHFTLTVTSAVLTAGAAGDVAVLMLMRSLDRDLLVKDHPNDVGFFIVRDNEPSQPA